MFDLAPEPSADHGLSVWTHDLDGSPRAPVTIVAGDKPARYWLASECVTTTTLGPPRTLPAGESVSVDERVAMVVDAAHVRRPGWFRR